MSLNQNWNPLLKETAPLACPHCATPLTADSPACHDCDVEITTSEGIPTLRPGDTDRDGELLETDELTELASRVERDSIREATADLPEHEGGSAMLERLFDVECDAWQALAAPHIGGRCLDVGAGFGRRAMTLAERGDVVYAVDPNLSKLRIAAARDDYDSAERVLPLQTTEELLPFSPGSFDTITADLSGSSTADVRNRIGRLSEYLTADGTLLVTADGWPRRSGLADLLGVADGGDRNGGREFAAGTPGQYRSMGEEFGFDDVSPYALVPNARRPLYAVDVEAENAVRTLAALLVSERVPSRGGRLAELAVPLVSIGSRTGLLEWCYPSLLLVCTNDSETPTNDFDEPLLVSGRARSVVLETGADGVDGVWKLPNRETHAPLTDRENAILSYLGSRDHPIIETLPEGEATESALGPARRERPARGASLDAVLSDDPHCFERTLRLGFDWLVEFQTAFRGPTITRSPAEVRADLRFEPTGLEPPSVDESVETFSTPVHGDYMPRNVYVRNGTVTNVIDWEYGAVEANPVVDAGFFVLNTAARCFGGMEAGIRTALREDTEYARITRSTIRRYCDAVGLPPRSVERYLPAAYLHRLELDWQFDAVSTYTEKVDERSRAVEIAFEQLAEVDLG